MKPGKPIEFKGTVASLSALTVALRSNDVAVIADALAAQCGEPPEFFSGDIALLDAEHLPKQAAGLDWVALVALLRRYRLNPVAVRNASPESVEAIRRAGLTLAEDVTVTARKPASTEVSAGTPTTPAVTSEQAAATVPTTAASSPAVAASDSPIVPATPVADAPPGMPTRIIDKPLRSGQQLYARNADLVVLAMVNPGAEVMADGNIHIYAPLRGRALAGAAGNSEARILTTCFEAELVSIGGVYRPLEPGMPKEVHGKPAQVRLVIDKKTRKQTILIEALKIV